MIHNEIVIYIRFAEKQELRDYKFFCFDGKMEFFKVDFGRFVEHHANYYNRDKVLQDYGECRFPPMAEADIKLPSEIDNMIDLAEKLSSDMPFVRIDLYDCNNHPYFGEMTFYPAGGVGPLTPEGTDAKWGKLINIKIK